MRLYKSLVDQRTQWIQRIHAELYQHGVAVPEGATRSEQTRALLASDAVHLSAAARQRITVGHRMIEATDAQVLPLKTDLQSFGRRQPAVSSAGRRPLRHRRADRGGGVVRARRLPTTRTPR